MKEEKATSLLVEDADIVKLLSDPNHLQYIGAFIGKERTIQEVAEETRNSFNTTYKRVQRYCKLGLLVVTKEVKRKGRAIKHYKAVADIFLVPQQMGLDLPSWYANWYKFFGQTVDNAVLLIDDANLNWGYKLYRDQSKVLTIELVSNLGLTQHKSFYETPAFLNRFHDSIYLNFEDAKALQKDLSDVWVKYSSKSGAQRYFFQVIVLPVREADAKIG